MATGMELILNLRSAREWTAALEDGAHLNAVGADATEESARRLERILSAARQEGLKVRGKARRKMLSALAGDLALYEGQIGRAIQYLQRRQASGAYVEGEWRVLTAQSKSIEEGFGESRAALRMAEELPALAGQKQEELRIRGWWRSATWRQPNFCLTAASSLPTSGPCRKRSS